MNSSSPASAASRRLRAAPQSVREARQFVESALPEVDADTVFMAQLLTSELVTNAVLHAGTDIEVRAWAVGGRVSVRVFDGVATRLPIPHEQTPEAGTGRGLHMVEQLSAACGVDVSPRGKTVWFELWPNPSELKPGATWAIPRPARGDAANVVLADVPVGLSRAAQRHRAALLREARLALLSGDRSIGVGVEDIREVAGLNDLIDSALSSAVSRNPDASSLTVELEIPQDCGPVAEKLSHVIDVLNSAAQAGVLLTRPSLPEVRRLRTWLLTEVSSQLSGRPATPWVGQHDLDRPDPPVGGIDFDPTDVNSRSIPAVAGDDDNTIVAVNEAAAALLGWGPTDLVGQRITVLVPPDWRERHVAGFTNFLLTGESTIIGQPMRVPALHRSGATLDVFLKIDVEQSLHGRTVFVAELKPVDSPEESPRGWRAG